MRKFLLSYSRLSASLIVKTFFEAWITEQCTKHFPCPNCPLFPFARYFYRLLPMIRFIIIPLQYNVNSPYLVSQWKLALCRGQWYLSPALFISVSDILRALVPLGFQVITHLLSWKSYFRRVLDKGSQCPRWSFKLNAHMLGEIWTLACVCWRAPDACFHRCRRKEPNGSQSIWSNISQNEPCRLLAQPVLFLSKIMLTLPLMIWNSR